jgi:hypothetical protein
LCGQLLDKMADGRKFEFETSKWEPKNDAYQMPSQPWSLDDWKVR